MELKQGAALQGGKYIVERMLGQGGFGITYLGMQKALGRRVAIKEFFMKEHCNRDASTSHVSVGSAGARQLVDAYRQKFLKEARTLAEMDNRHIVRVIDVFEENGTAYYVMEYVEGGSLSDLVRRRGSLPEAEAVGYIRQLAEALAYLHGRRVMHLDVKPGNLMLRAGGELVLIDFGIAKHYDTGNRETSGTPVGRSTGYAPMEQYQEGGVREFSPATDIYSAGATLYFLLTATTPPSAQEVYENGLPALPRFVSAATSRAVSQAMQPRRKDRPQTAEAFLALLPAVEEPVKPGSKKPKSPQPDPVAEEEDTIVSPDEKPAAGPQPGPAMSKPSRRKRVRLLYALAGALLGLVLWEVFGTSRPGDTSDLSTVPNDLADTVMVVEEVPVVMDSVACDPEEQLLEHPHETPASHVSEPGEPARQEPARSTQARRFDDAVRGNDLSALRQLADEGYAPAYAKLATRYLQRDDYDRADAYARRALAAREGVDEAWRVVEVLDGYGYYHNGDHGGKPSRNG